ncbi:MAG: hypothetical protein HUU01_03400 [Saprospiraceae bacterium]|nr:hypothetical protein [Saprospiraceae bacterium]
MTIFKSINTLVLLLFTTTFSFSQGVEKVLVKSFNLQGSQAVLLELDAPTEVKTWKNDLLRVQMTITLSNGSESMLKSLIEVGRYNLKSEVIDGKFKVFAPALAKEVKIGGKTLDEHVSIVVFGPEGVQVKLAGAAAAQAAPTASSM